MSKSFNLNDVKYIRHGEDPVTLKCAVSLTFKSDEQLEQFKEYLISIGELRQANKTQAERQKEFRGVISGLTGIDMERFVK